MRRVYVIYVLRHCCAPVMLKMYVLAAVFAGLFSFVSVGDVFANMPPYGLHAIYDFAAYALMHTENVVRLLLAAAASVLCVLIRDLARAAAPRIIA